MATVDDEDDDSEDAEASSDADTESLALMLSAGILTETSEPSLLTLDDELALPPVRSSQALKPTAERATTETVRTAGAIRVRGRRIMCLASLVEADGVEQAIERAGGLAVGG
jgi:hypothetical protein